MIRRAIGTTLVGLCALTGPLAFSALADTADPTPALTLSVSTVRQGIPFTVNGATGCPIADGTQTVQFSYTDSAGLIFPLGSVQTDDDGTWSDAAVALPVAGVDDSGTWLDNGVATGAGTLDAICVTSDDSGDPGDPGDPGDGDSGDVATGNGDSTDPGGDSGDPGDGSGDSDGSTTLTYASADLTTSAAAPQITVSPVSSTGTVTVTPAEACTGTGAADVEVDLVGVGDNATDDPAVTGTATSTDGGVWTPITLTVPDGSTGDYAVTATCSQDGTVTSSYDSQPLGLGTVLLSKPACTARGAVAQVSGTYSDQISSGGTDLKLGLLKLTGAGPWKVQLTSSNTGQLLLAKTLTCAAPLFNLTVPKTGVAGNGQVQAKVCNTGRASAVALLQIVKGNRGTTVDQSSLNPGDCTWLQGGPRLPRGGVVKAQVLINPPGNGTSDTDVAQAFTARRPRH